MSDPKLGTVIEDPFPYGGMRWTLLGKQIGRHLGMTDQELVAFGNELGTLVDDRFNVPEGERLRFSIAFVQQLSDAIDKVYGKHKN